jgi:very-long-chain enoyl-CoA reductase
MLANHVCDPLAPKQPIKSLPANIEIPDGATVEDVKKAIAKKAKIGDPNRVGLFDTATKKTFKDRRAVIMEVPTVADSSEVMVKDLGKILH